MSSYEKTMKKQCHVFSIDKKKMPILAEVDADVEMRVDIAAMLGLSISTLNMIVSKQSEIENSYSHCGPLFSKISEDFATGRT
jgi:hypothetical protein